MKLSVTCCWFSHKQRDDDNRMWNTTVIVKNFSLQVWIFWDLTFTTDDKSKDKNKCISMHHEKIASTFLKKCEEDKNWDKNKSILMYQGKKSSSFLKKCGKVSGNTHHFWNQFLHDLLYTKLFVCVKISSRSRPFLYKAHATLTKKNEW